MNEKTKIRIELNAAGKAKLAKLFGVTTQCVSSALLFRNHSIQSHQIRVAAIENGGRLVEMKDVTEDFKKTVKVLDSKGNVINK